MTIAIMMAVTMMTSWWMSFAEAAVVGALYAFGVPVRSRREPSAVNLRSFGGVKFSSSVEKSPRSDKKTNRRTEPS